MSTVSHSSFIVPLSSGEATDASRFGPKAANLSALGRAGLRIPDGFCLDADAYRHQVTSIGLTDDTHGVFGAEDPQQARQHALNVKLGLLERPIDRAVLEPLLASWRELADRTGNDVVGNEVLLDDVEVRLDDEAAVEPRERRLDRERLDEHLHPPRRAPARDREVDARLVERVDGVDRARGEGLVRAHERPVHVRQDELDLGHLSAR